MLTSDRLRTRWLPALLAAGFVVLLSRASHASSYPVCTTAKAAINRLDGLAVATPLSVARNVTIPGVGGPYVVTDYQIDQWIRSDKLILGKKVRSIVLDLGPTSLVPRRGKTGLYWFERIDQLFDQVEVTPPEGSGWTRSEQGIAILGDGGGVERKNGLFEIRIEQDHQVVGAKLNTSKIKRLLARDLHEQCALARSRQN